MDFHKVLAFNQMNMSGLAHPIKLFVGEGLFFLGLAPSIEVVVVFFGLVPIGWGQDFLAVYEALSAAFPVALFPDAVTVAIGTVVTQAKS